MAGSVLIAGIRPMLKRRGKDGAGLGGGVGGGGRGAGGGGLGLGGGEKGRPVVGKVGAEGNMLPFVVVGVEEEKEEEGKPNAATNDLSQPAHQKNVGGRIIVQPRSPSDNSEAQKKEPSPDLTPFPSPSPSPSPEPIPTPSASPPPDDPHTQQQQQQLLLPARKTPSPSPSRARGSISDSSSVGSSGGGGAVGGVVGGGLVGGGRGRLGVEDGKGLAIDSGAVGYAAVNLKSGKAMDAAIKQLVLAIRKDRQLRGHYT